jgi:hypothetical protein
LACATARDLAPYQSPTFRAVVVAPPPTPATEVINLFDHTGELVHETDPHAAVRTYRRLIAAKA